MPGLADEAAVTDEAADDELIETRASRCPLRNKYQPHVKKKKSVLYESHAYDCVL